MISGMGLIKWVAPAIAQFIIFYCYLCAVFNAWFWLYPKTLENPNRTTDSYLKILSFTVLTFLIQLNFWKAVFIGPGYVPENWRPELKSDEKFLQFCKICNAFKAPRSHHCRRTNKCVLKMDHYCPWIGTCVGHYNHAFFIRFLFFVPITCIWAIYIIASTTYTRVYGDWYGFYREQGKFYVPFPARAIFYNIIGCGLGRIYFKTIKMQYI